MITQWRSRNSLKTALEYYQCAWLLAAFPLDVINVQLEVLVKKQSGKPTEPLRGLKMEGCHSSGTKRQHTQQKIQQVFENV